MNKAELMGSIRKLKSIYTIKTFLASEDSINAWYEMFGKVDKARFDTAINTYIKTNNMPPTPADLMALIGGSSEALPTYYRMNLWGVYEWDGTEVEEIYANQRMSSDDIKKWLSERIGSIDNLVVRLKERAKVPDYGKR